MARRSAQIQDPEVIKDFRARFIQFATEARKEVEGVRSDVQRVQNWLQGDQRVQWRTELRKREEIAEQAKRTYNYLRSDTGPTRKEHIEDERQAMIKAQRRKEEAEAKLRKIKKWTLTLNAEIMKELKPCELLASQLAVLLPQAVARLDEMLDNLDIYMRSGGSGSSPKPTGKESSDAEPDA